MKERPILFSSPMVRAILEGRKTQTRRVMKPQPVWEEVPGMDGERAFCGRYQTLVMGYNGEPDVDVEVDRHVCPYGVPGDRLWVRETHRVSGVTWEVGPNKDWQADIDYRADDLFTGRPITREIGVRLRDMFDRESAPAGWTPSIFMPRWASRITLEITDVRVQRVNEISEEDAWSEGPSEDMGPLDIDGRLLFKDLWDSINAKRGFRWDANPWCWAITFKRLGSDGLIDGAAWQQFPEAQ